MLVGLLLFALLTFWTRECEASAKTRGRTFTLAALCLGLSEAFAVVSALLFAAWGLVEASEILVEKWSLLLSCNRAVFLRLLAGVVAGAESGRSVFEKLLLAVAPRFFIQDERFQLNLRCATSPEEFLSPRGLCGRQEWERELLHHVALTFVVSTSHRSNSTLSSNI